MAADIVTGMIPQVSGAQILSTILYGLIVILAVGMLAFLTWHLLHKNKYSEFYCRILEEDSSGNVHESYDRAGIFLDKSTGFRLFFLEKAKKGLNPNKVPYISAKVKKGLIFKKMVLIKIVTLRKIGVSNYVFVHPKLSAEGIQFTQGEEDMNWGAQELEKIRRTFGKESLWSKLAPYIMFIITIVVVMIILISLFNKFTLLKEVSDNMLKISENQERIAGIMLNTTTSPNMNPGMPIIVPGGTG